MALQKASSSGWQRRLKGLVYLGIGSVFGLFATGLTWAVGDTDDYYDVPSAGGVFDRRS